MVSEAIHYLLYIAISACIIAPVISVVIIRKAGKTGIWAFVVGILAFFSITMLQSMVVSMLSATVANQTVFYILYILLFVAIEGVGLYFFMRVLVRDTTPAKCLATGAMFGSATAVVYAMDRLLPMITMVIAINSGEYENIYQQALAENADVAQMYRELHDLVLSVGIIDILSLVLFGVACVVFFAFMGALLANAFDDKPIFFLYTGLAALVFEAPALLINNLAPDPMYAYAYQVVVAIAAAVLIKLVVKDALSIRGISRGEGIELNPRLR